ncbi:hypothetical protein BP6252_10194 [Coleophoma cylindrospora]|uniref:Uncharacterized protein n=1 Tax=Coleophoma cylindrospora TaxID=1849047 RepID=A0A3D8QXQ4_9HELO|nr:hypothetical protein BP6252_10194 [Coleophoma cylindrospora]
MEPRKKASPRSGSARARPDAPAELQFVHVVPNGPEDKKSETRSIVRANAAYFHWRHNRPPQDKPRPRKLRNTAQKHTQSRERSRAHDTAARKRVGGRESSEDAVNNNHHHEIGQHPMPPEIPEDFTSRCLTYNAQVILPAMFPDAVENSPIRTNLLHLSLVHAPLLQLFIMGSLIFSQGALGPFASKSVTQRLFQCRAEVVRLVNAAISNPAEACNDINIFAVSALAFKGSPCKKVDVPLKIPKQGPLRSLQFLSAYAMTDSVSIHVDGLSKLIEIKGGLDKIEIPGLASLISLSELRVAIRDLTMPRYPIVTLLQEFSMQYEEVGFNTDQDLYQVLVMLKSYTKMIDDFCEGRKVVAASVLIDHRNLTQHALFSLPARAGNAECYRLAAMIYSLLVTFPLPYTAAPFQGLVTLLKTELAHWEGDDEMIVWVLTIGAIGAIGLKEREWFVKIFGGVTMSMGIRSWDRVTEVLQRGLWYEATNNGDGIDLWTESQAIVNESLDLPPDNKPWLN